MIDRIAPAVHRITAPGGWCLVMVPLDVGRAVTLEDPAVHRPDERLRAYWQEDHVRLYGTDVVDRIAAAGFSVETIRPLEAFGPEVGVRCGLAEADWLMLGT